MARVASLFFALLLPWLGGCQPDEYAILISARSQRDVSAVRVTVIPLNGGRTFPSGTFQVNRTAADIADNEPIRIAIALDGPREVLVHLEAEDPEDNRLVASRCYRVTGVVEDRVLLVDTEGLDADGDGWLASPAATCFDADGTACTAHQCPAGEDADCDDADGSFNPGAQELCADGLDQNCRDGDIPCGDKDGDDWDSCSGTDRMGTCDCNDDIPTINPGVEESSVVDPDNPEDATCEDGIDQNCDDIDAFCDRDGDGFPSNVDCDDDDRAINPDADEVCTPRSEAGEPLEEPADENCDGRIDELLACEDDDLDGDGQVGCWHPSAPANCDCNDCDPGIHTNAFDQCGDGIDADCNGTDQVCNVSDADHDGVVDAAAGGSDCDDANAMAFPGAPELCTDTADQNCDGTNGSCDGDTDGDGYVEPPACEGDPAIRFWAPESCNGVDDDCDMTADEVLSPAQTLMSGGMTIVFDQGFTGCVESTQVDFRSDLDNCRTCGSHCNTEQRFFANVCMDGRCLCTNSGAPDECAPNEECCAAGCQDVESTLGFCGGCTPANDCNAGRPTERPLASQCVDETCQCGVGPKCADTSNSACCSTAGPEAATCVDTSTDSNHCGVCNHSCGSMSRCTAGHCVCTSPDYADCNGNDSDGCETNIQTSLLNCGGCGNDCTPDHATGNCSSGTCGIASCDAGWDDCNGDPSDGCETRLDTLTDCGACGRTCTIARGTGTCSTGTCEVASCDTGWGDCSGGPTDGCETQLNTLGNCGGCGTSCSLTNATPTCSTGSCRIASCDAGWDNCDTVQGNGCERSLSTVTDCGSCGTSCSRSHATPTCTTGSCQIQSCDMGWGNCDGGDANGCEADLSRPMTCQSCMTSCMSVSNGTATCSLSGGCGFTCDMGYHACGGSCVSNMSVATCGTRCTPCPAPMNGTATCSGSSCGIACDSGFCAVAGSCVADNTPAACGSSCTACAAPANATATCSSGSCGFTCNAGFADCNGMASDGCEVNVLTGMVRSGVYENCGACGATCGAGETCTAGACCCGGSCAGAGAGEVCNSASRSCCGTPTPSCQMGC